MKKLLTVLATPVLCFVFVGTASAATITNTGPGSTNVITNNNTQTVKIVCINDIKVDNKTSQGASSGNATNSGNTNSGNATSGSSNNSSNTNTSVNSGCPGGTKPVAAGSPEAKAAGGGVAPAGQGGGSQVDAQGRLLPATGVDDVVRGVAIAAVAIAMIAIVAQTAASFYRRRALN